MREPRTTLTKPQRRALEIVRACGPIGGAAFAAQMWPQCKGKRTSKRAGYNLRAGSYLSWLNRHGLLSWHQPPLHSFLHRGCLLYELSEQGARALDAAEEQAP